MKHQRLTLKRQRVQPTDATGCGWAFFALLFAIFFGQFSVWVGVLLLLAIPFCLIWQVWRWVALWKVHQAVLKWCKEHYPDAGGSPIVDLMIAVTEETSVPIESMQPTTSLDSLNSGLKLFDEEIEERFTRQNQEIPDDFLQEYYELEIGIDFETEQSEIGDVTLDQVRNELRLNLIFGLLHDARILDLNAEDFEGATLGQLVQFVVTETRRKQIRT